MEFFKLFFKKFLRYILKPLSFLPAVCMMYIIFSFSAQTGSESGSLSYQVSKTIVLAYNKFFSKGLSNELLNELIHQIHPFIRKTAHFTEFFALAITVSFPLYVYKIRGIFLIILGELFCVGVAFLDEYTQGFVSGRNPSYRDVMIDSTGAFCGILIALLICYIGRKTVFNWLSLEDYRKKKKAYHKKIKQEKL